MMRELLRNREASPALWFKASLAVVILLSLTVASHARGKAATTQNVVYVNGNVGTVSDVNAVYGYSNDGAGILTPLPGSPYLTGGTGSAPATGTSLGLQTDDDQQIITNAAGTQLFTVNMFSNTIAVFNINSDASLSPILGSPFNGGGPQTASLGLFDNALGNGKGLLVAVNKASDPNQSSTKLPNLQTFTVAADGTLTHNAGSQKQFGVGASPSQAAIGPNHLVFAMEFAGGALPPVVSQIDSYRIRRNGTLALNNSVQVPPGTAVFLGEAVHPTQNILYAALPADNKVAVYTFDSTGILTFSTTVADPGVLACWVFVSPDGKHMYTGETMSNSVGVFDLTDPLNPVALQSLPLSTTFPSSGATNMNLDPTGKFLYALSNSPTGSALHVLNVAADGTLTETTTPVILPVPAGNWPVGIATLLK